VIDHRATFWLLVPALLALAAGCHERNERKPDAPACGPVHTAKYPAAGLTKVVLRASAAASAEVRTERGATEITVSGRPCGFDANTPSSPGSVDGGIVFKPFGSTLLATTRGEFVYIHFGATMKDLVLTVPPGVEAAREAMVLNKDQEPDLRPPGAPPRSEGHP
jgi:hypothetical protein